MAITLVDSSQGFNAVFEDISNLTLPAPVGVSNGDIILIGVINRTISATMTGPSGFTQIDQIDEGNYITAVWRKEASSESGDYDVTTSNTNPTEALGFLACYSSVDGSLLDVTYVQGTHHTAPSTSAPNPPAITTVTNGAFVVNFVLGRVGTNDAVYVSGPSGYAVRETYDTGTTVTTCGGIADFEVAAAGSEDPGAWDFTNSQDWGVYTLAIRPAADVTKPLLTLPTTANLTNTTLDLGVTTANDDNGTLYVALTSTSTKPSEAQVELSQDHLGASVVGSNQAVTATGIQTISASSVIVPGTTYYPQWMHKDAAGNQSLVITGDPFTLVALPVSAVYDDSTIPSDSLGFYSNGTHTGANNASALTTAENLAAGEYDGLVLRNNTDLSATIITNTTAGPNSVLSGTLASGTDNDWDTNDTYNVEADIDANDIWYCEGVVTATSNVVTMDYYVYDDSAGTYTGVETQTINAVLPDGDYNVSISVTGVPTFTSVEGVTESSLSNILYNSLASSLGT